MSIMFKHILRNIKDKKLMSALIILSIAISGALLFVALTIGGSLDSVANNEFESASLVFMMIFGVTVFLSIFVVYSSFKYIMAFRIKTLGTFRSVGASKKRCRYTLLLESLVYGFIAALFAMVIGIVLLTILSKQLGGGDAKIKVNVLHFLYTLLFCIALSPICAWLPIKASEKFSVKEIILQTNRVRKKRYLPFLIVGISLIAAGGLFVGLPALKYVEMTTYIGLLFILSGFVMSVGPLIHYFMIFLSIIFPNSLTAKNLKENKAHSNIAVLLAIAVAIVFLVNGANGLLIKATDESFALYNYQAQVTGTQLDDSSLNTVRGVAGVTQAEGMYYKKEVVIDDNMKLMNVYGVDYDTMKDFFDFNFSSQAAQIDFETSNTIVLSKDYMAREKLKISDKIKIKGFELTIIGIVDQMFPNGNVGFIHTDKFLTVFDDVEYFERIAVKSDLTQVDIGAVLRTELVGLKVATIDEMQTKAKEINANMFTVLDYIVILATIAGVFGVLNNLLIAFNSQKRERALLRSIGMSKKKGAQTTILESLTTGIVGGVLGLLGGLLLVAITPSIFVSFEFPVQAVPISPLAVSLCIICSVAICTFASIISLVGNNKLNIITTLREEIL